jgi:hypothetical protein
MWAELKAGVHVAYDWCCHHTTALLAGLAALFGMALERKLSHETHKVADVQTEVDIQASLAHAQISAVMFEKGAAAAHVTVNEKYQAQLQALDAEGQKKAVALLHDPAELARFLVLTGRAKP